MRYVSSHERIGMEKGLQQGVDQGLQQGILQGLQQGIRQGNAAGREQGLREGQRAAVTEVLHVRFTQLPREIVILINALDDIVILQDLLKQAVTIPSIEEFAAVLRQKLDPPARTFGDG